jgi:hypothetical protein
MQKKQSSGFGTNDKITGPVLTDEKQRKGYIDNHLPTRTATYFWRGA